MKFIRQIDLEFCTISLREDGIVEQRFHPTDNYEVTAKDILAFKRAFTIISNGKKIAIISISGQNGSLSKEARDIDINTSSRYTIALGLVIKELPQRLLANFYFKVKKIEYPVKSFKKEQDAIAWLDQQIRASKCVG